MSTFIKSSILFFLVLLGTAMLLNVFQKYFNNSPDYYKKQYLEANSPKAYNEGIILGASHATHSMRPTYLDSSNVHTYNFALNGSNPEYYLNWYNKIYLRSNKKPEYCLYSINYFMFDEQLLWRNFDQDSEYFPFDVYWNEFIFKSNVNKKDLILNRYPIFKYRSQVVSNLIKKKNIKFYDYDRGYISYSIPMDSARYSANLNHSVDSFQVECFKTLIKKMVTDSVKIIFIMTPEYGLKADDYSNMESMYIISQIAKNYGIPFLNYNNGYRSNMNMDMDLYNDWGHMNAKGSLLFSKKLAEDLKSTILHKTVIK